MALRETASSLVVLTAILLCGCSSYHEIEAARERGATAGREEGRKAGEQAGYSAGYEAELREVHARTVRKLHKEGQYHRSPLLAWASAIGGFVLGHCLQWIFVYIPRKAGLLRDIDQIILPGIFPGPLTLDGQGQSGSRGAQVGLGLVLAVLVSGCSDAVKQAWQEGYDANRGASYLDGWQDGERRGRTAGAEAGIASGTQAAHDGADWRLYLPICVWGLAAGFLVGLTAQYTCLACARVDNQLPGPLALALVPAMRGTLSYGILERRIELLKMVDEETRKLGAARELKMQQIETIRELTQKKIKSLASIEQFSRERLLELAKSEIDRVVSKAEEQAVRVTADPKSVQQLTCPHCRCHITYRGRRGGKTVRCPNRRCGRPVDIPKFPETGDR